jgi:tRNA (guanosine-2'-O-)-methyltransferase
MATQQDNPKPPGDVAQLLESLLTDARRERIESVIRNRTLNLSLVLENIHDPHNGSACLRSAEALGIIHVCIIESVEPLQLHRKISQGCEKWMVVEHFSDSASCARHLIQQGYHLWAAHPRGERTIDEIDFKTKVALVFGNEHAGITKEMLELCHGMYRIPMQGFTESLNISVAVALSLYHGVRERARIFGTSGDLTEVERLEMKDLYYRLAIPDDERILPLLQKRRSKDNSK